MKHSLYNLALFVGLLATHVACGQSIKVLTNHIGYEQDAPKRAVIALPKIFPNRRGDS